MRIRMLSAALALGLAAPLSAQAPAADAAERDAVLAVVTRMFDAMRQGDSAMLRSVFHPEARLATAAVRNGAPVLGFEPIDRFVQAVGSKPADQVWDERLYNSIVHVDGTLATVWTDYDFYLGDRFSHCGVDSFQLAKLADGWKVFSVADTRQREGCPDRAAAGSGGTQGAHGNH